MVDRDDIFRMAIEAGARDCANPDKWDIWEIRDTDLERFAALVAAHEREECAKVCEEQMKAYMSSQYTTDPLGGFRERFAAERCAAAIRARGEK
jgi:hypothetical protein